MENHTNQTYQERMNKTALSKFGAIEKHLEKGVKLLDFGSGFSPEFIEQVQQTGAHYVAYDVSQIVQNQLKENDIDFLTKEQLANTEDEFKECQLHVNGEVIEIKPKDEPIYIEKSPAMQEPTLNQMDYIRALCTFYECDVPDVKTSGQASRWLSTFLKTHDYKTDKRKAELRERYQKIFDDHASGMTMGQLIEKYQLTKPTIRKAIKAIQNNTV